MNKKRNTFVSLAIGGTVAAMMVSATALANGQFENRAWQFDTAADKSVKAGIADLQERKEGGYFDGFGTTVNNTITNETTIMGDQINCDVGASSVGNTSSNLADSRAGSPTGADDTTIGSDAIGNTSSSPRNRSAPLVDGDGPSPMVVWIAGRRLTMPDRRLLPNHMDALR